MSSASCWQRQEYRDESVRRDEELTHGRHSQLQLTPPDPLQDTQEPIRHRCLSETERRAGETAEGIKVRGGAGTPGGTAAPGEPREQ